MKALQGIRVLDFSWLLPGPYATQMLADFGAEVIKIEQPGRGDYTRDMHPDMYQAANRNKRSMTLDLKSDAGRELALRLLDDADVLVEGFRPGVMARLGLGPDVVMARNPRLVYCSISGYGQDGPYRNWPGHDIAYMGVGGGFSVPGDLQHPAVKGSLPVADLASAMFAAFSIQGALMERQRTGQGQYLDVAMSDCVAAWAGVRLADVLWNGEPPQNKLSATSRIYEAADGRRICLAVTEDPFWVKLCQAIAKPEWLQDERLRTLEGRRRHAAELLPELEQVLRQRSAADWLERFAAADVPAAPVHGPMEVFEDPQIRHRGVAWQAPPDGSGKPRRVAGFPVKFGHDGPSLQRSAPALGEDTDAVLLAAGLQPAEIARLRDQKVI